jgi:hypothetical protein
MSPLSKCSHRIAAAAAMVDDFEKTHKTLAIGAEELANISSYQTLPADKNSKSY